MSAAVVIAYAIAAAIIMVVVPAIIPTVLVAGNSFVLVALTTASLLVISLVSYASDYKRDSVLASVTIKELYSLVLFAVLGGCYTKLGVGFYTEDMFAGVLVMFVLTPAMMLAIEEIVCPLVDRIAYEPARIRRRERRARIAAITMR